MGVVQIQLFDICFNAAFPIQFFLNILHIFLIPFVLCIGQGNLNRFIYNIVKGSPNASLVLAFAAFVQIEADTFAPYFNNTFSQYIHCMLVSMSPITYVMQIIHLQPCLYRGKEVGPCRRKIRQDVKHKGFWLFILIDRSQRTIV